MVGTGWGMRRPILSCVYNHGWTEVNKALWLLPALLCGHLNSPSPEAGKWLGRGSCGQLEETALASLQCLLLTQPLGHNLKVIESVDRQPAQT